MCQPCRRQDREQASASAPPWPSAVLSLVGSFAHLFLVPWKSTSTFKFANDLASLFPAASTVPPGLLFYFTSRGMWFGSTISTTLPRGFYRNRVRIPDLSVALKPKALLFRTWPR